MTIHRIGMTMRRRSNMTARLIEEPTQVPLHTGEDVTVEPGYPWPSAYRGSKYSLINSPKYNQIVQVWQYDDLQIYLEPPDGLVRAMRNVGKSKGAGTGSFRVTAGLEVLTKVWAERYPHSDVAPVSEGWVPVYLGKFSNGDFGFTDINNGRPPDEPPAVWEGLPFHHGETWAVGVDNKLIWKKQGFRFYSAFDHPELIDRYARYRTQPGRLYITENGCVWVNVPRRGVPSARQDEISKMFDTWRRQAKQKNKSSILRLVRRRLKATGEGDSSRGHLPVYLGQLSDFDNGTIPRVSVNDNTYFVEESRNRED